MKTAKKLECILSIFQPKVLVRLTYPSIFPDSAHALKDLNRAITYFAKSDNRGMWFLCFQERGAPYFYLMLSKFVPKDELARAWYEIVGSNDPAHLKAGTSVSGFQFQRGAENFLEKIIGPVSVRTDFKSGTFGSLKAKVLAWL